MKKITLRFVAVGGLTFIAACSTTEIPDQQSVDTCRDLAGIEIDFIVETSPTGERSLKTDPPGSTVPVKEAIAFENCLKSIS